MNTTELDISGEMAPVARQVNTFAPCGTTLLTCVVTAFKFGALIEFPVSIQHCNTVLVLNL